MSYVIWPDGYTGEALRDVNDERRRQELLKQRGKFAKTCADDMPNTERLAVLSEEFGEVAREVCEQLSQSYDPVNLRAELIQVAAVAVAWVEALDKNTPTPGGAL